MATHSRQIIKWATKKFFFSKRLFTDLREDTQCVGFVLSQQVICRWQFARLATTFVPLNLHLARRSVSWYHHNHYIITIMIPSQSWYHHNPDIITILISSQSWYHHNPDIIIIIISSHPVIITIMISSQSTIIDNALKMITDHLLLQHSSQRSCLSVYYIGLVWVGAAWGIYIFIRIYYIRIYYILYTILYTHKDLSSGTTFLEMKLLPQCVVNSFPVWLPPPFLIMYSPTY